MLKRIAKPLSVALIVSLVLSGCSMFDKNRRRELAYERYVRKNMRARQKQILRSQKMALRRVKKYEVPTDPKITATVEPVSEPAQNGSGVTQAPSTTSENDGTQTEP
jgi:hypothetical protein